MPAVVSKRRKSTPPPTDAGIEDGPVDDDEPVQTHGETEKPRGDLVSVGSRLRDFSSLVWDLLDLDSGSL